MTLENAVAAAFEDARQDNYQHPTGLDPDMIAEECSQLIDVVDNLISLEDVVLVNADDDPAEERMSMVLREAFVRAFEAGLAVGLEAGEEGMEVTLHIDRETVAGLVQRALSGDDKLKE